MEEQCKLRLEDLTPNANAVIQPVKESLFQLETEKSDDTMNTEDSSELQETKHHTLSDTATSANTDKNMDDTIVDGLLNDAVPTNIDATESIESLQVCGNEEDNNKPIVSLVAPVSGILVANDTEINISKEDEAPDSINHEMTVPVTQEDPLMKEEQLKVSSPQETEPTEISNAQESTLTTSEDLSTVVNEKDIECPSADPGCNRGPDLPFQTIVEDNTAISTQQHEIHVELPRCIENLDDTVDRGDDIPNLTEQVNDTMTNDGVDNCVMEKEEIETNQNVSPVFEKSTEKECESKVEDKIVKETDEKDLVVDGRIEPDIAFETKMQNESLLDQNDTKFHDSCFTEEVLDESEYSYEEIIVDDEDEYFEYVDEILDEVEDESEYFTEQTLESQDKLDQDFVANGESMSRPTVKGANSRASLDGSVHRFPQIKSATQKALEEEAAKKKAEAKEGERNLSFRLARQSSFVRRDEELEKRLKEEEEEHLRKEEEREQELIAQLELEARHKAEEAAALIAQQEKQELRKRLEEAEALRKIAEAETRRLTAEAARREKEAAEKARREAEAVEKQKREEAKRAMEEEVHQLEVKLAEAKLAALEAKKRQLEEKKRLRAQVETRRKAKKENQIAETTTPKHDPSPLNAAEPLSIPMPTSPKRVPTTPSKPVVSPSRQIPIVKAPLSPSKLPVQASASTNPVPVSPSKVPASPGKATSASVPQKKEQSQVASTPTPVPAPAPGKQAVNAVYYSVEDLRKMKIPGLDYKNREIYLSPESFQEVFGVTKEEFEEMPKWKRTNMKRKQKLF